MNAEPDVERLVSDWLAEEAPARAPNRILLMASDRLDHASQRSRWITWRFPTVNPTLRVGAAAVIGLVLLGGGLYFLGGRGFGVGTLPTPTECQDPVPSAAATVPSSTAVASSAVSPTPDYSTLTGTILLEHFGNALDGSEAEQEPNPAVKRLYLMDSAGLRLLDGPGALDGFPASVASPDWSPDGSRIAFSGTVEQHQGHTGIYEREIGGDLPLLLTPEDCAPTCRQAYPDYSPDGSRIAFVEWRVGSGRHLVAILDIATGAITPLMTTNVAGEGFIEKPRWSPDGKRIVYAVVKRTGDRGLSGIGMPAVASQIRIVDVATGEVTSLHVGLDNVGDASWSPDGRRILFAENPLYNTPADVRHEIYTVNPDGTDVRRWMMAGLIVDGAPSWTPDGRILVFHSTSFMDGDAHVGGSDLWLMDADFGNAAPLGESLPDLASTANGWAYYGYWQPSP